MNLLDSCFLSLILFLLFRIPVLFLYNKDFLAYFYRLNDSLDFIKKALLYALIVFI